MKNFILITALAALSALNSFAQTPAALPTYIALGASFNQIGTPRTNIFAAALYPTGMSSLEYTSTTVNVIPKSAINPATGKKFYTFETATTQSLHKIVYQGPKFVLMAGGGLGAAFSQASPSGVNVNIAASFTGTLAYQFNSKWGLAVPVQGIYTPQGWDLVPAVAVVFKP